MNYRPTFASGIRNLVLENCHGDEADLALQLAASCELDSEAACPRPVPNKNRILPSYLRLVVAYEVGQGGAF